MGGSIYSRSTELEFTNREISTMLSEQKISGRDLHRGVTYTERDKSRRASVKLSGAVSEREYVVKLRAATTDERDFSVILSVIPKERSKPFHLRRYNGEHVHKNHIEDERFFGFHIHKATERYQQAQFREPEHFAEVTDRFASYHEALECFIEDCNIVSNDGEQPELLAWKEQQGGDGD